MGTPRAMAIVLWLGSSALGSGPLLLAMEPPAAQEPARQAPAQQAAARQATRPQQDAAAADETSPEEAEGRLLGVRITAPSPEAEVAGRVRVRAEVVAAEPSAVAAVDFFIDGRLMFSDAEAPYELLWNSGRPAGHLIEVRAYGPGREVASDSLRTGIAHASVAAAYGARVERVELHARIEDEEPRRGKLSPSMFEVRENGVVQPVVEVERVADLPLAVGILVDHSRSMFEQLETALDAAGAFVAGLLTHAQDKAFVLGFADIPIVFQEFTNDVDRLSQSIEMIDAGRYTALYDAVAAAAARFEGSGGRRAVVLLTDGSDQGSDARFREAIAAAQRADVALYPVAVELSPRYTRERWILHQMAEETGGRVFSLGRRTDPAQIYDAIADDLRAQYRISYTPLQPGGDGEWREVEIFVRGDREEKKIRSRPGYFAR